MRMDNPPLLRYAERWEPGDSVMTPIQAVCDSVWKVDTEKLCSRSSEVFT